MKAVAVVLIVLQALAALGLFALSVHAPSGLVIAAPIYLVAGAALTWWAARKSWLLLIAAGILAFGAAPGIYLLLDLIEQDAYRRLVAASSASDVRDEPILSPSGRPIGVRLSYTISVPKRGYHAVLPSIEGLQSQRWTFDGRGGPELGPFQAGKGHRLVVELYPPILHMPHQETACLVPATRPLPPPGAPASLRVSISDTPYAGMPSQHSYDLATLYRNVAAEGWPACKVGQ